MLLRHGFDSVIMADQTKYQHIGPLPNSVASFIGLGIGQQYRLPFRAPRVGLPLCKFIHFAVFRVVHRDFQRKRVKDVHLILAPIRKVNLITEALRSHKLPTGS